MKHMIRFSIAIIALGMLYTPAYAADSDVQPFLGRWALDLPGGGAGWLSVTEEKDGKGNPYLDAEILWGGGSVVPVSSVSIMSSPDGGNVSIMINRIFQVERKDEKGKTYRVQQFNEGLWGRIDGEDLKLMHMTPNSNSIGYRMEELTGKRIPDLPEKPDLSALKFGEPITLFNGKDLTAWKLTDEKQVNGWSVKDGVLVNDPKQEKGKDHIPYGNLRTEQEFEDFNLKLEVNVLPNGNSGIYLRGIYEVQVADTFGKPLDPHNMGGIYSRITPSVSAEKKAGEWQTYDITLCNRHVTVILNGTKIIDNEPLLGCTGGALWSDEFRPGPIYLQGDHTGVNYRNIILTPIVK